MEEVILFLSNNENTLPLYNWLVQQGENVINSSNKVNFGTVKHMNPKIIISYNYKYLISQEVIQYVSGRIFNLHISYLPWNRGSDPNYWSFIENTPKGVTIHQVDKGLDTGDIVVQKEMIFDEGKESFATTYQRLHREIVKLFIENWSCIKQGTYHMKKQNGNGSFHTKNDLQQFLGGKEMDWEKNIRNYKEELRRGRR